MTAPVSADQALRLLRARAFLYSRASRLYGARSLLFDLEKGYRDFDAMLKRGMLYLRFGVREVVAEARAEFSPTSALLTFSRQAGPFPEKERPSRCDDLLRRKGLLPSPGTARPRIDLGGLSHEVEVSSAGPDQVELRLLSLPGSRRRGFRASDRSLRLAWFQSLLTGWMGSGPALRLEDAPDPLHRAGPHAWTVSRRISQVDIDLSGEDLPHVFRWKEAGLAKSATFADLDEADIAAALEASGIALPRNAHLQARLEEDLGQGAACLLLRYAHLVPDPGPDTEGDLASVPPRLSPGYIVMENDYLEILIDGGTGKVFSEARKWRPEPDDALPTPPRELAASQAI